MRRFAGRLAAVRQPRSSGNVTVPRISEVLRGMREPVDRAPAGAGEPATAAELLTAQSAAARLGVAERTIRRAIDRGELRAVERAGKFHITLEALDRYERMRSRSRAAADDLSHEPGVVLEAEDHLGSQPPGQPLAVRSSLPVPLTSLVGREREIESAVAILRGQNRLLTLTGPGGVGKTRLAAAVATEVAPEFADGVSYVALASITDPGLVAQAIASVLGVREAGGEAIEDRLLSALRERHLLLVLDNFEQVVEAAPLLSTLLAASPLLQVLVTSRIRLRLTGERSTRCRPSLSWRPTPRRRRMEPSSPSLCGCSSSGRTRCAKISLSRLSTPRLFGHLPAPGRSTAGHRAGRRPGECPPTAGLLARLERRLPLLTLGRATPLPVCRRCAMPSPGRYDLLTEEEQALFRRLAVFVGGSTLDAAEWVAGARGEVEESRSRGGDGQSASRQEDLSPSHPATQPPSDPITPSPSISSSALVDKSLVRADVVMVATRATACSRRSASSVWSNWRDTASSRRCSSATPSWYLAFAEDAGPRAKQSGAAPWVESLSHETSQPASRADVVSRPGRWAGAGADGWVTVAILA